MRLFEDFIPIPEELWSFETGAPLQRCAICDCDLLVQGTNYLIEKAFKGNEVMFEYAMCTKCCVLLSQELSVQSKKLIDHYFDEYGDLEQRRLSYLGQFGTNYSKWVDRCMVKDTSRSECDEFQVYAWCIDRDLVFTGMPYMLSGDCIDDLLGLLSEETLGILNDFSDKVFGVDLPQGLLII
ncbi:hypothetical protein QEH52_14835 [Coraliomargarita sp. SDUM461003]|uniref:Uncharacterized protein n=1 Tax=Thalassobacterium maritimum TaxID=3041265 RepID=A0ABU1AXB8_9BACT|nr:hypothetical protein [Coraliomargarita sp. SDUM461003]MDQ8208800.1 hypothetical protein [Coraliomargarita sp. SDUM461003]